jgi:uncharacterized oligopeptide transporter (OPT) family protein
MAVPVESEDYMESTPAEVAVTTVSATVKPREITARALIFGCVAGAFLSAGNVYTGLKTGWADGGGIATALVGFAFFSIVKRFSPASFGALENNIAQTTAASAAIMGYAIGLPSTFPALAIMGHSYDGWALSAWGIAVGVVGILIASTLRQKLILEEKLPFPTGAATAEVIETIGAARQVAMRRASLLMGTAALTAAFVWFRDGRPALFPQAWMFDAVLIGTTLSSITVGLSWSPLLVSTGMFMGERAAFSMLAGGAVSWIGLAPWMIRLGAIPKATFADCNSWLIWPGLGMLLASGLVPLFFDRRGVMRAFGDLASFVTRRGVNPPVWTDESTTMPFAKTVFGIAVALSLVLAVGVFHVGVFVGVLGLGCALIFGYVCSRTTGETDLAPTGAFGTLTQVALTGHGVTGTVIGGSMVSGAATQAAQTLWAFKTGDRLGASPRAQLGAQLLGCVVGAFTSVPAYFLLVRAYGIATVAMPAPAALSCKATALAVQHGLSAMPRYSAMAGLIGFGAGVLFSVLSRTRASRYVPSPAAMGIAIITPFSMDMAAFIGGVIVLVSRKASRPGASEANVMAIAAGGIAGESVMGVIVAALIGLGILASH